MNIYKKWLGNGKEERPFDFLPVDTNIFRLNNDEEIIRFLSLNQFLINWFGQAAKEYEIESCK
jgi:hypothetical protein